MCQLSPLPRDGVDLASVNTVVTDSMVATTASVVFAEASMAMVTMSTPTEVTTSTTVIKETTVSLTRATATPHADMEVMVATPFVDMADTDLATVPGATATVPDARATAQDTAAMAASMVAGDQAASVPTEDAATATVT